MAGGLEQAKMLERTAQRREEAKMRAEAMAAAAEERRIDNERAERIFEWNKTHPTMQFADLQGMGLVGLNTRDPNAPPVPVGGGAAPPAGGAAPQPPPAAAGSPPSARAAPPLRKSKDLGRPEKEELQAAAEGVAGISRLAETFRDEYAGGGALKGSVDELADRYGGGGGVMGEVVGAITGQDPEAIKERSEWWRTYEGLINLPERNRIFGASLSEGERKSWEQARKVARGSDHQKAREALLWLQAKAEEKLAGLRESAIAEGAEPSAVSALTRTAPMPTSAPSPSGQKTPAPVESLKARQIEAIAKLKASGITDTKAIRGQLEKLGLVSGAGP
jgi:hypothetical protein